MVEKNVYSITFRFNEKIKDDEKIEKISDFLNYECKGKILKFIENFIKENNHNVFNGKFSVNSEYITFIFDFLKNDFSDEELIKFNEFVQGNIVSYLNETLNDLYKTDFKIKDSDIENFLINYNNEINKCKG